LRGRESQDFGVNIGDDGIITGYWKRERMKFHKSEKRTLGDHRYVQ
jgi:hypothetical protein